MHENVTNPMQLKSQRCEAHCRTTQLPCLNWAMPNGRCRMHGGKSKGRPTTSGAHTMESKQQRQRLRDLTKTLKRLLQQLKP